MTHRSTPKTTPAHRAAQMLRDLRDDVREQRPTVGEPDRIVMFRGISEQTGYTDSLNVTIYSNSDVYLGFDDTPGFDLGTFEK